VSGAALAVAALLCQAAAGVAWVRWTRAVRVPRRRAARIALLAPGALLGALALAGRPGWLAGAAAVLAIALFAAFALLNLASGQERRAPAVRVGQPFLDFTAADEDGTPFHLGSLRGRPFLLKFFRGHW
jgi:hypothetical protein